MPMDKKAKKRLMRADLTGSGQGVSGGRCCGRDEKLPYRFPYGSGLERLVQKRTQTEVLGELAV